MAFLHALVMQSFEIKEEYLVVLEKKEHFHHRHLTFRMLNFDLKATEVKEAFEKAI